MRNQMKTPNRVFHDSISYDQAIITGLCLYLNFVIWAQGKGFKK
jgi:hypothetical protein